MNVLVTSAGAAPAVDVIKSLKGQRELDIKVLAVDRDAYAVGFGLCDKYFVVPSAEEKNFIGQVLQLCVEENVNIVFPILEDELMVFSQTRALFKNQGVPLVINSHGLLELAFDKYRLFQFCKKHGISTPNTYLCTEVQGNIDNINFPLVIKKRKGRRNKDILIVDSRENLEFYLYQDKNIILQEFFKGVEYTVEILTDLNNNILTTIPRERIQTKAGISTKARFLKDDGLIDFANQIVRKFIAYYGVTGPLNLQLIRNGEEIQFIEANPKFPGGGALTLASGVNIPLLFVKLIRGIKVDQKELDFMDNTVIARYWEEVILENCSHQI